MQPEQFQTKTQTGTQARTYDVGLRAHMQSVYNRMTVGVLITALTSYFVASTPALLQFFFSGPQMYVVMFAPLAVLWFGFRPERMNSNQLRLGFLAICVLYGISFSTIFLAFTNESIARAFFIAAGMFAGLSIFGYTTKKNLDGLMTFAVMGVMGVFFMSIGNIFFRSEGLFDLISAVGIIAFAGVTAWQTQATKEMYSPAHGAEGNSRMAWAAALNLYISFIAMFQYILHFVGNNR
ncbi:MAG: Bax inhibitor-1/YccA family protein [Rhodospirillales bacterium]|nr:Bax inhibitor-1/YccA family protein [Rhodospirillales bacterium]